MLLLGLRFCINSNTSTNSSTSFGHWATGKGMEAQGFFRLQVFVGGIERLAVLGHHLPYARAERRTERMDCSQQIQKYYTMNGR